MPRRVRGFFLEGEAFLHFCERGIELRVFSGENRAKSRFALLV